MTDLRQAAQQALMAWACTGKDMSLSTIMQRGDDLSSALRNVLEQPEQEPDRQVLQTAGTHPAPCARHCEAKAFEIEIRSLNSRLKQQPEQEPVAQQYAKLAQHCTMLEQKLAQLEQRKPLTASEILNMMPSSIPAEHDGALMEFARAVEAATQPQPEPTCPKCKAAVLYECVACSSNNYPTRTSADTKNTPAAAQRKPLTDEQIQTALHLKSCEGYRTLVRRIEAAHGIREGT